MSATPDQKLAGAREQYEWYIAYIAVGFTVEQALAILTRPVVSIQPSQYPPEFMEAMERQSALATKMLADIGASE